MSITTKLVLQAESTTETVLRQLDTRINSIKSGSRYESLATLIEISSELSQFTGRSTDDLFHILTSSPQSELKESIFRLVHQRGPPKPSKISK